MQTITLSSKGQLVIPKPVRESAHLSAGDVFSVRYVDGEIRLKPIVNSMPVLLADVAGCLGKAGRPTLTEAQTRSIIAARLKAKHTPSTDQP